MKKKKKKKRKGSDVEGKSNVVTDFVSYAFVLLFCDF